MSEFVDKHWISLLVVGIIIWWLTGLAKMVTDFYNWIAIQIPAIAPIAKKFAINNFLGTLLIGFIIWCIWKLFWGSRSSGSGGTSSNVVDKVSNAVSRVEMIVITLLNVAVATLVMFIVAPDHIDAALCIKTGQGALLGILLTITMLTISQNCGWTTGDAGKKIIKWIYIIGLIVCASRVYFPINARLKTAVLEQKTVVQAKIRDLIASNRPLDLSQAIFDTKKVAIAADINVLIEELKQIERIFMNSDLYSKSTLDTKKARIAEIEKELPRLYNELEGNKLAPFNPNEPAGKRDANRMIMWLLIATVVCLLVFKVSNNNKAVLVICVIFSILILGVKFQYDLGVNLNSIPIIGRLLLKPPQKPPLTLQEEKGCEQRIVRLDFNAGDVVIPTKVDGGDAFWGDGHPMREGTGRPVLERPPLRICVTDPNMIVSCVVWK